MPTKVKKTLIRIFGAPLCRLIIKTLLLIFKTKNKMFKQKFERMSNAELEQAIDYATEKKESKIYAAKRLADWFEVDFTIKIFGQVILEWHYPPKK